MHIRFEAFENLIWLCIFHRLRTLKKRFNVIVKFNKIDAQYKASVYVFFIYFFLRWRNFTVIKKKLITFSANSLFYNKYSQIYNNIVYLFLRFYRSIIL